MDDRKSKTQKKRDADALQKLGVKLIELNLDKLGILPLAQPLKQAIIDAKSLKSRGAMRRQAQLIGKLMRTEDNEAIMTSYEQLLIEEKAQTAAFHLIEQWRKKLIHEGKAALTQFINDYPSAESQQLRQLIKKAASEQHLTQHTGASKQLFRYIRSCMS